MDYRRLIWGRKQKDNIPSLGIEQRKWLSRLVFGGVILSLLYRLMAHALLSQLAAPVFIYPYVDLTYWALHLINIPQFISRHYGLALCFDILLFIAALGGFFFIQKRVFPITFGILYLIYFVSYNSFGIHHTHCMVGVLLISIPFWFRNNRTFTLLWEGLRYFTLWIYFSAFLWKLLRGSLFNYHQGLANFMNENATHIALNPDGWLTPLYTFFIAHPGLSFVASTIAILMEGLFFIGFFTKKYDWWWFVLPIIFHTMTYLFIHVMFYELLILNLTFLSVKKGMKTGGFKEKIEG